ncbi:hypothetical protein [Pseudomonas granadensis]|uniref:hypothetical protein n=1 Tax=Pseudomonas granadensis TaxID=1421430 RepID=UPI001EF1194F|nr:hypothetical protein [Pseudomonas granadensis]
MYKSLRLMMFRSITEHCRGQAKPLPKSPHLTTQSEPQSLTHLAMRRLNNTCEATLIRKAFLTPIAANEPKTAITTQLIPFDLEMIDAHADFSFCIGMHHSEQMQDLDRVRASNHASESRSN